MNKTYNYRGTELKAVPEKGMVSPCEGCFFYEGNGRCAHNTKEFKKEGIPDCVYDFDEVIIYVKA